MDPGGSSEDGVNEDGLNGGDPKTDGARDGHQGGALGGHRGGGGRALSTGVAWNVASLAVLAVAGIALNVLIGRVYGPAALGVFNQVMGAYVLFSMAAAGGINYSLLRAVAAAPRDPAHVAGAVVGALPPTVVLAGARRMGPRADLAAASDHRGILLSARLEAPAATDFIALLPRGAELDALEDDGVLALRVPAGDRLDLRVRLALGSAWLTLSGSAESTRGFATLGLASGLELPDEL